MNNYIALDIGGTEVKYCYCLNNKPIFGRWQIQKNIAEEIKSFLFNKSFGILAVSAPGPFDYENGISLMEHKLRSAYGISLKTVINQINPQAKVLFYHDAVAFAMGILAQNKQDNFAGVMLGTGLGYIVVKNKKPIINAKKMPQNPLWSQPYKNGIAEDYVSGTAILNICRKNGQNISSVRQASILARSGQKSIAKIFNDIGEDLGELIEQRRKEDGFLKLFIGGQISQSFDLMEKGFKSKTDIPFCIIRNPAKCALDGLAFCIDQFYKENLI